MGDIIINLDKPRKLVFDLNAMSAYEEVTGESVFDLQSKTPTAKMFRALVWAALLSEDENITLKEVGKLITSENMTEIQRKMDQTIIDSTKTGEAPDESTKN